nr:glycosyltransferase family 9 protein [uncultured Flavobacterium sp.]
MLKKINEFRRILTTILTKNIGNSYKNPAVDLSEKVTIKRVLICRPNHRLGNLLLITPFLQEISSTFPKCKIDLFVKGGLGPIIFKNYENIDTIIELPKKPFENLWKYFSVWIQIKKQKYDVVINIEKGSSSGRIATKFANANYKFFGKAEEDITSQYKDYEHIAKYPIYDFRLFLTKLGFKNTHNQIPPLNIKLSNSEIANGKKILDNIVNNEKKTICIFTYATADKCYSESWWEEFYEKLKNEFQNNYNIIEVLPVENISQISFKAPTFYSKDIREIGSLITNTVIFIGADSGIMHLSSSVQTTTVGLFSRTNQNMYEPYGNNSLAINTNINKIDECINTIKNILNS